MPKPRQPQKIKIDPLFIIPAGAEDIFVYSRDNVDPPGGFDSSEVNVEILGGDGTALNDGDSGNEQAEDNLGTPDDFYIISQTVERGSGGIMVVDVVLGIEEVPGATNYDVQVIKQ